jgi:hypothetical protein
MVGVGLYTSDCLTDSYAPVGMGSREELIATFNDLTQRAKDATARLWKRIAGWTRDQMIDAGAITYFAICKDIAHVAGCYDPADWIFVDERAERFRPLLNDEYGNMSLYEILGPLSHPGQRTHDYALMQHSNLPANTYSLIPYSILDDGDHTLSCGDLRPGVTHLDPKVDRYRTTRGVLSIADYNAAVKAFTPRLNQPRFRFRCESWLKYHYDTPLAGEMYRIEQEGSRTLEGRGAGLRRADIEALRK